MNSAAMASLRRRENVNYKEIHEGEKICTRRLRLQSRTVLPETDEVERLIDRRRNPKEGEEYLVKWKGWGIEDCTYEPACHIPIVLRHQFEIPEISEDRLNSVAELITRAVQKRLSSRTPECIIPIHFDVFRFVFGNCKDKLVSQDDFQKLPMCSNWFYKLNSKGEGLQISFPVRVTRRLILKPTWIKCSDGLLRKKAVPVERMKIISTVSACSLETL